MRYISHLNNFGTVLLPLSLLKNVAKNIVPLSPYQDLLIDLQRLLTGNGKQEKKFCLKIQQYNAAFAFTSMGCNADTRVISQGRPEVFHVHGKVYHTQGPLEANSPQNARYAQLYFYDSDYAADLRHQQNPKLDQQTMGDLTQMLEHHDLFISVYRTVHEQLHQMAQETDTEGLKVLLDARLSLVVEAEADRWRYNLPVANKISMIMLDEKSEKPSRQDIQLQLYGNANNPLGCHRIDQNHAGYMALHYVLLFPHGNPGWHWGIKLLDVSREQN